jgi:hypothetical protein
MPTVWPSEKYPIPVVILSEGRVSHARVKKHGEENAKPNPWRARKNQIALIDFDIPIPRNDVPMTINDTERIILLLKIAITGAAIIFIIRHEIPMALTAKPINCALFVRVFAYTGTIEFETCVAEYISPLIRSSLIKPKFQTCGTLSKLFTRAFSFINNL